MKSRLLAILVPLAFVVVLTIQAQPPAGPGTKAPGGAEAGSGDLVRLTDRGAAEYKKFEEALLRLVQRMEARAARGSIEDRDKAAALRKAIDLANKEQIENRFSKLLSTIITEKQLTTDELTKAAGQNEELVKVLRDMLEILLTDSELLRKKEEADKLEKLIKQVDGIIKAEKITLTKIDGNRVKSDAIKKEQEGITKTTESVARAIGAKKDEPKKPGDEATAKKGDPNDKAGEPKDDTKDPKGDMKDGDPKAGDPKAGDPKAGDPKAGDPKAGDPKAGDPKAGDPKAGDPKAGDPKAGDPKAGDPKAGDPKAGDPKKPEDSKPAEQKNKPDNKGESKGESGEPKDGKPSDGKPSQGKSPPSQSSPSESKPNQGDQPPSSQPNQPPPPGQEPMPGKKQIQVAIEGQKKVEDNLEKDKRDDASKKTEEVIKNLEDLKKELEKRLKQLREEELERLLANLQARCEKMLAMQIEVQAGTKRVHSVLLTLDQRKPTRTEEQQSQALSTREGEIVKEASRTLNLMSSEGSAVAFAMSLENVRDDMMNVERRLDKYDVGEFTQQIEQDIIDSLRDMIEALKKKQQEMKDQKNNPPPPSDRPPPPRSLLDLLAELKLIRAQQVQVNKRTQDYARHYEGEQAEDPLLMKELEQLARRQAKLEEMLKKIATGKNQ